MACIRSVYAKISALEISHNW